MVFDSHRALEPWLYLSFQVFKALFATLFFIIAVVGYAQSRVDAIAIWGIAVLICKA